MEKRTAFGLLVAIGVLLAGCIVVSIRDDGWSLSLFGGWGGARYKHERTVELSAPLQPGGRFTATTENGAITVAGVETETAAVVATIEAHATSEERAMRYAEETSVTLEESAEGLVVKIDRPDVSGSEWLTVSLDVKLPRQTVLDLTSHNGAVRVSDVSGDVKAVSHNGAITGQGAGGQFVAETHNGRIDVLDARGDVDLVSHNGAVDVAYAQDAPSEPTIRVGSDNGAVEATVPRGFSGRVELRTDNGSITSDLPVEVTGRMDRNVIGRAGQGAGLLSLETNNGSVRVKTQ